MRCQHAASPARWPWAARVPASPGCLRPPGASRASACRALITQPVPRRLWIAVSVMFMMSPWAPTLLVPATPGIRTLAFHPGTMDLGRTGDGDGIETARADGATAPMVV
jgi:hypothetical protein